MNSIVDQAAYDLQRALGLRDGEARVLAFLQRYLAEHPLAPTRQEIASACGFASANAAEVNLKKLVVKGFVEIIAGEQRGLRLTERAEGAGKPQYLYVMRRGDRHKVGISILPDSRRVTVQSCEGGLPVDLIWRSPEPYRQARKIELATHKLLKRYHVTGEWFSCSAEECMEAINTALRREHPIPLTTEKVSP